MALAEAGGREPLVSPAQVGRSLAAAVLEEGGAEEGRWRREEVEESMEFPVHREVQLPGGLTYLYLASGVPTQVPPTHNTHHPHQAKLSTSNSDTGEFRLAFDKR